ncbi:MAG: hypothetical protein A2Z32_04490 [Chloroflexi bacterium RBG_16_69_14]|nr:MAG: hypothetical protein A2Z32_04490 [Chloroflexi bacterium RBG_16_69_14]
MIPHAAHGAGSRIERGEAAEWTAKASESGIDDHGDSERDGAPSAADGRRTLVGPKTVDLPPV